MSQWSELSHLAAIRVSGPDAGSFAQSQFSVDAASITGELWSPLAWCDPRGRVLAVMLARTAEQQIELVLPTELKDSVMQKLPLYAIGHDVQISPTGPVIGNLAAEAGDCRLKFDPERALSISAESSDEASEPAIQWQLADLCQALPWLLPATSGRFLPQALGLEELDAVSYTKGCYPGQEIIARVHFLGRVKQQLVGLLVSEPADIEPDSPVDDGRDAAVGSWLWGIRQPGYTPGLAVVDSSIETGARVRVQSGSRRLRARVTPPEGLC